MFRDEILKRLWMRARRSSLDEFAAVSFEPLLAFHTTEMICLSFMRDSKFSCLFVQNYAADRISRHVSLFNSHNLERI